MDLLLLLQFGLQKSLIIRIDLVHLPDFILEISNLLFVVIPELRQKLDVIVGLPEFGLEVLDLLFHLIDLHHLWVDVFRWKV